jgi:glutathione S-transferase
MLTLYYFPGACSMAAHVALEETETAYERKSVNLRAASRTAKPSAGSIRGEVPVLERRRQASITQSVAILTYVGRQFPQAGLLSSMSSTRRVPSRHGMDIERGSPVSPPATGAFRRGRGRARVAVKGGCQRRVLGSAREIDALLEGKAWMMGAQYTVCDPYALVYYGWAARFGLPVKDLVAYTQLKDRLLERPAVRRVLEREQSLLLGPMPTSS